MTTLRKKFTKTEFFGKSAAVSATKGYATFSSGLVGSTATVPFLILFMVHLKRKTMSTESRQSPEESAEHTQRRDRAAIAAQACQTCRNRKSKCDEQRPKCGLCRRLNVDCQYREPQPTKKDKTMVHILETLTRLENKFDNLPMMVSNTSNPSSRDDASHFDPYLTPSTIDRSQAENDSNTEEASTRTRLFENNLQAPYRHLTPAHKIILWPAVYLYLTNSKTPVAKDLPYVLQDGTPWLIHLEFLKNPNPLPSPYRMQSLIASDTHPNTPRHVFAGLSTDAITRLTEAYFNTFNVIHPILIYDTFVAETISPLLRDGYRDDDPRACLSLLVLALGQVALDGVFGQPTQIVSGSPSGLRGGSAARPPGLELYNEARRIIGFSMNQCTLENVQIFLLQAAYNESCARHTDFWRSCVAASTACQVLIVCESLDWSTARADLVKRAYWTCILNEDLYHVELDLPETELHTLEDQVPLPYFQEYQEESVSGPSDKSNFQYHFLAMIALRRLITRIHSIIHGSLSENAESAGDYGGPPIHVIKELSRQLSSWHNLLPQPLQWTDPDRFEFPNISPLARRPTDPLFVPDHGMVPVNHSSNLDIVTGQLRTRFYYAKFMIYRPFIYKALHFPEQMTVEDADYCALALRSACMWPLAMAPPKNKKRLVPHLFTWTQNFVGILLLLRMTTENDCLRRICDEKVNKQEIETTVALLLDWIRDMKQVDGIAEWSWRMLEPLFGVKGV